MSTRFGVDQWQREKVFINTFHNGHMAVDVDTERLTFVRGIRNMERDTFTFGTKHLVTDTDSVQFLCYFSQEYNDVTYYVTSQGEKVILQVYETEPNGVEDDERVFEFFQNKKKIQFKSCTSKELYLCLDETGFSLKQPSDSNMDPFQFDIIPVTNPGQPK